MNDATRTPIELNAQIVYTNAPALAYLWRLYSGPASVTFSSTNQPSTTVSFPSPGQYILMFSADNGVHAVAHDAPTITVGAGQRPGAPPGLRVVASQQCVTEDRAPFGIALLSKYR